MGFLTVVACLVLSIQVAARPQLSARDKSQIIRFILQHYDFSQTESCCDDAENIIYLLAENISLADVPSRKGLTFTVIERDKIDRLRKTGVEYYQFSTFEIAQTDVRLSFMRTFLSPREGNGSVMKYTCRKVGRKWKLKARLDGVYAS